MWSVAEDLGERMRCSHVLGHQRGGFIRIGACSSRTGADADRRQRASATAAIELCGQTTLTACVSIARRPLAAAPAGAAKRRNTDLVNGASLRRIFDG